MNASKNPGDVGAILGRCNSPAVTAAHKAIDGYIIREISETPSHQFLTQTNPARLVSAVVLASELGEGPDYVSMFNLGDVLGSMCLGNKIILDIAKEYEKPQTDSQDSLRRSPEYSSFKSKFENLIPDSNKNPSMDQTPKPLYVLCLGYSEMKVEWDDGKQRYDFPKPKGKSVHAWNSIIDTSMEMSGVDAIIDGSFSFLNKKGPEIGRMVVVSSEEIGNGWISGRAVYDMIANRSIRVVRTNCLMLDGLHALHVKINEDQKLRRLNIENELRFTKKVLN